jgi:hypothetical protein
MLSIIDGSEGVRLVGNSLTSTLPLHRMKAGPDQDKSFTEFGSFVVGHVDAGEIDSRET